MACLSPQKELQFLRSRFSYNNYQYVILSCTTDNYAIILSDYSVVPIYLIHYGESLLYGIRPARARERERERGRENTGPKLDR